MSNETIVAIFILGIILIIISSYFLNKPKADLEAFYNKELSAVNAKCIFMCRYISGLPDLIENISCFLYADEQNITIMPADNKDVKITLQISKIKIFQYIYPIGVGNLLIPQEQGENNSIIIHYESKNGEIKKLVFSLEVSVNENSFNNYAISQCDIGKFVNERIPKQKTTIDL